MIDQIVFTAEWAILCERWGKTYSGPVTARYYQHLSARMDTASFRDACAHLFAESEFFPKPDDFVSAVQASDEARALDQWDLCYRVMEGESHVWDRMSPAGRRVVALLGGPSRLGDTPIDSVPFVRRDFLAFFREVTDGVEYEQIAGSEVTPESRRIVGEVMRSLPPANQTPED